jgi:hypothetical protein
MQPYSHGTPPELPACCIKRLDPARLSDSLPGRPSSQFQEHGWNGDHGLPGWDLDGNTLFSFVAFANLREPGPGDRWFTSNEKRERPLRRRAHASSVDRNLRARRLRILTAHDVV